MWILKGICYSLGWLFDLKRIYNEVVYLGNLSSLIVFLMAVVFLGMTFISLFNLFFKKESYKKSMILTGILARGIILIGFIIEIFYEIKIHNLNNYNMKITNFLFLSYLTIIVIHYIFIIYENFNRIKFYIFDSVVLSSVVIYNIFYRTFIDRTANIISLDIYFDFGIVIILYIILKLSKLSKKRYYVISLILSIFLFLKVSVEGVIPRNYVLPISVFILFLILYKFLKDFIKNNKILKRFKRKILVTISIIIIIFSCPFFNIWTIVEKNYTYEGKVEKVSIGNKICTLEDAKNIGREITGDSKGKVILNEIYESDFYDRYSLDIGDYNVVVDGSTSKVFSVYKHDKKNFFGRFINEDIKDIGLSQKDIIDKSINYLKKLGITYDSKYVGFKYKKYSDNGHSLRFYHKYSDGSFVEEDDLGFGEILWLNDGTLKGFSGDNNIFKLEDYKVIGINHNKVNDILVKWYRKLNKPMPLYSVVSVNSQYIQYGLDLNITCNNGDYLIIDSNTLKVINYSSKDGKDYSNIKYNREYRDIKDISKYNIKNMKISKEDAKEKVLKKYNIFSLYGKKVKPVELIDKKGNTKFKWMVVVVPYKTREHHIYFVDADTGNVDSLYNIKNL